jgi:hypothetical protein
MNGADWHLTTSWRCGLYSLQSSKRKSEVPTLLAASLLHRKHGVSFGLAS